MERIVRKQTYLTPAQDRAIKRAARQEGVTEAEIIRRAVDAYLRPEKKRNKKDAILPLIGTVTLRPGHSSQTVDRDLYGAPDA